MQSVRDPDGPFLHSGVSAVPQQWQLDAAGRRLRLAYLGIRNVTVPSLPSPDGSSTSERARPRPFGTASEVHVVAVSDSAPGLEAAWENAQDLSSTSMASVVDTAVLPAVLLGEYLTRLDEVEVSMEDRSDEYIG